MAKTTRGILRRIATRGVVAALPVAIASAYASGLFIEPPRLAEAKYQTVAEITTTPSTVGVATSPLYGQPKALIEQQLDELLSIGVTSIRVFVPWGLVEPVDNFYNWSSIDDIMSAAAARNMGVMAQVNATPIWGGANGPGLPLGSGAPNVNAFTDFMGVFANRYKTTVSAYEIWNEPNYYQFFNPISPEAYTTLLKAVYPILKAADPTATVVAGAVGTTQTFTGVTMNPVDFVRRMLAAGAADFFDALSVHPYGDQTVFSGSCPSCPSNVLTPRQQVEAIMGMLSGKKVWITEYGVATGPGGVSEAKQAAWLKDLLDHWQTYDPDLVGPVFLYTIRDALIDAQNPNSLENFFGLFNAIGGAKAAADMLRDWIAAHPQDGGPVITPPTGVPTNPLAQVAAVLQQVVQAVVQTIQTFVNAGVTAIQSVIQAIANLFAVVSPPTPAGTLSVTDVDGSEAAMRSASFVSEQGAAESVDGGADEGTEAVADTKVTAAVDSGEVELAVEPVTEPVVEPVTEPVVETVVEPAAELEVVPVQTPAAVEATAPESVSDTTPAASDVDSEGKASTDSSSASAAKPAAQSNKPDDDGATSHKSGVSTSRMTSKSPKSESVSASKSESKSEKSTGDSAKPKTVSATAGAGSSSDSSSAGSSDSTSSGSDD